MQFSRNASNCSKNGGQMKSSAILAVNRKQGDAATTEIWFVLTDYFTSVFGKSTHRNDLTC